MDTRTLVLIVAIGAMWLSLTSGCVATYLILSNKMWSPGIGAKRRRKPSSGLQLKAREPAPTLVDESGTSWGVYVLFESPSPGLNERLRLALSSAGGVYESSTGAFTVKGESSRNPIYIENAFPPGALPSFTDDNVQYLIKGVRIKVVADSLSLSPNKLQLVRLVSLAKGFARLGGSVVDAKKQPITKAGFKAVIAGKATV